MAKKQKRKTSRGLSETQRRAGPQMPLVKETHRSRTSRRSLVEDFNPDYGYVITDLKRIGIMAVSFFGILVVLSFILH